MSVKLLYRQDDGAPQVFTDDTTDDAAVAQQNLIEMKVIELPETPFTLEITETSEYAYPPRTWYHTHLGTT